jgi:alpha-L-fucosidase
MIHWGPSAVPAWAPTEHGSIVDILRENDWKHYFAHSPYAQWYANGLRLQESDVRAYHNKHFGRHVAYERFAKRFTEATAEFDATEWAGFFSEIGARYVVMGAKHQDGYLLWPSDEYKAESFRATRDLVGITARAVREQQMRFGVSYSGQLDWTVQNRPIRDYTDLLAPVTDEYAQYAEHHLHELVDRYKPDLLWNDIGLPAQISTRKLFRAYREAVPEGVLNDRWHQIGGTVQKLIGNDFVSRRLAGQARRTIVEGRALGSGGDVATVEYAKEYGEKKRTWELIRGTGRSFGYNRDETEETTASGAELIRELADVVSRNGNLLLSVGPDLDGTIPLVQRRPLADLGSWLAVHGEAIYGTRPFKRCCGTSAEGVPLRFTTRENTLYIIALERPPVLRLTVPDLSPSDVPRTHERGVEYGFQVTIIGSEREIDWSSGDRRTVINIPGSYRQTDAMVIKLAWRGPEREPDTFYTDLI